MFIKMTTVIDIDTNQLPTVEDVSTWSGEQFANALRHNQACASYNLNLRQLIHVGYKIAAQMGDRYLDALDKYKSEVAK